MRPMSADHLRCFNRKSNLTSILVKNRDNISRLVLLPLMTVGASLPAAGQQPLTVVELFTSQGCSSCPPANANLIKVSDRKDVLALSFAVTYWDYLGWKDTNGKQEFTDRQVAYEPPLRQPGPYTPQMVFNGTTTTVGFNLDEIERRISEAPPLQGPELAFEDDHVEIGALNGAEMADVWLVSFDPKVQSVPVERGENVGTILQHTHVVRELVHLGAWNGERNSFALPAREAQLKIAILVQQPHGGKILSALSE